MGFASQRHQLPNAGMSPVAIVSNYPIFISTSSLPGATVGSPYSATLTAGGGNGPYMWSITSGALPPGLSLSSSGVISGTPTTTGTYNFTIQVVDQLGAAASVNVGVAL
jgi:hypothetical protein